MEGSLRPKLLSNECLTVFPVEAFQQTLKKLADILLQHEIPFHLTGGVTTIAYAEPRMTQDIDIVVSNEKLTSNLESVIAAVEVSEFLFDEKSLRGAVKAQRLFQLLDSVESLKLDIYPRELIQGELDRSEKIELFEGVFYPIACRTDTAIAKLLWIDQGSHKSRRDLRLLYQNGNKVEQEEIQRLSQHFGKSKLLSEVLAETDEIDL